MIAMKSQRDSLVFYRQGTEFYDINMNLIQNHADRDQKIIDMSEKRWARPLMGRIEAELNRRLDSMPSVDNYSVAA